MNKTEQINTKYIYMKYFYQKIALLKKIGNNQLCSFILRLFGEYNQWKLCKYHCYLATTNIIVLLKKFFHFRE